MFIFQRAIEPTYGIFVMNRLGVENLMANLNPDMEVQIIGDYVIYRKEDGRYMGALKGVLGV